MQPLELAIAEKHVRDYSDDAMRTADPTDDGAECERRLQLAMDAFRWIDRAEDGIRQATYAGLIEYTPRLEETIESLYRAWLAACEMTEKLLARQVDAGEFREVASLAREKLNSMAWVRKSRMFRNESACDVSEN